MAAAAGITALLALRSASAREDGTPPTVYDVTGSGLHVTYSTGAGDGKPHLTFVGPRGTVEFSGDEIRTVQTPDLGTLVSVTTMRTIDSGSTTFTLVVPPVVLEPPETEASIEILGITTAHRFTVVRRFNRGQRACYSQVVLSGTARASAP